MEPEYIAPESGTEDLTVAGGNYLEIAESIVILNEQDYTSADNLNANGKEQIKKIEVHCDPRISQAHEMHKGLLKDKNQLLEPIKKARSIIGNKMSVYADEQTRIRLAEETAQRKKDLEAEQERKKKFMENKRLESQQLQEAGRNEEAQGVLYSPDPVENAPLAKPIPQPIVPRTKTKFQGGWDVEVIDIEKVPDEFIIYTADIQLIKARVKSYKGKIEIPGIRITAKKTPY